MPYDKITSLTNARVKRVIQLRNRSQRMESGLTIVEGVRETARALEADVRFEEIYIRSEMLNDPLVKTLASKKVPIIETMRAVFAKMSYGDRDEGVLAVCAPEIKTFNDFDRKKQPLFLVVESVEKPGNLGAILRTCDGSGIDGVIISDGKTDIYNPNVIRASLGTVFSVRTVVSSNEETYAFLKARRIKICATLPETKTLYTKADLTGGLAVVVGSEQDGLTEFWKRHADLKVRIPMLGSADSLNVSVSAAILLYEAVRQRSN